MENPVRVSLPTVYTDPIGYIGGSQQAIGGRDHHGDVVSEIHHVVGFKPDKYMAIPMVVSQTEMKVVIDCGINYNDTPKSGPWR